MMACTKVYMQQHHHGQKMLLYVALIHMLIHGQKMLPVLRIALLGALVVFTASTVENNNLVLAFPLAEVITTFCDVIVYSCVQHSV